MALKRSGVELVAENLEGFFDDIARANKVVDLFTRDAERNGERIETFGDATTTTFRRIGEQVQSASAAGDRALDRLGDSAHDASGDLTTLTTSLRTSERELDRGTGTLRTYGRETERAAESSSRLGEIVTGAYRRIGEAIVDMAAEGVRRVKDFFTGSLDQAGDFQAGMLEFSSVTGEAVTDAGLSLDTFRDKFLQIGKELPVSTARVQEAATELARGGVEVTEILDDALTATLNLAGAGQTELAPAATITARALGVWRDQGVSATEVANLFTQAANASTVGVEDLALGLYNSQGSAKAMGDSLAGTVTMLALLSPGFSSAATAGTAYNNFLARIQPSTAPATAAMRELGLWTEEAGSAFFDAQGHYIGGAQAAELLRKATENLTEAEKAAAFQTIFGNDAKNAAFILAEKGAAGYNDMAAAMDTAGTASEQAAKKQTGYNIAVDNTMGSVEALQITVGTGLIPIITELLNTRIAPGINTMTRWADAFFAAGDKTSFLVDELNELIPGVRGTATVVGKLAGITEDNLVPALTTASTIMLVMGAQQVPMLTAALIRGATAWTGYGAAMTILTAGPFVVAAAAIFGLTKLIMNLQETYANAARDLLETRDWWNESTRALDDYALSAASASVAVQPLAAELEELRRVQEAEILSLGKRMAAGNVSEAQYAAEMKVINARAEAIQHATDDLNLAVQATEAATYAQEHGTVPSYIDYLGRQIPAAAADAAAAVSQLTEEELTKLQKVLDSAAESGTKALDSWVQTTLSFRDEFANAASEHWAKIAEIDNELAGQITADRRAELETQRADLMTSYAQQQQDRAAAYATEAAAHKAHLGEMLIETVNTWALMGQVPADRAAEMTTALAAEYGVQASNTQLMFGQMIGTLLNWRDNAGTATSDVISDLQDAGETALETEQQMTNLSGDYVANLIQNFMEGKLDADELRKALERVPAETRAMIITNAEAVAAAVDSANSALDRLRARANTTVNINANIARPIKAESPSPMETSLRNIHEIIRTMPTLRLQTTGNMPDLLGGYADTPDPMGKTRQPQEAVEARLRKYIAALREVRSESTSAADAIRELLRTGDFRGGFGRHEDDPFSNWLIEMSKDADNTAAVLRVLRGEMFGISTSAGMDHFVTDGHPFVELLRQLAGQSADAFVGGFDDKKPMEQIARRVRTALGKDIPEDAVPYAGALGGTIGATMADAFGREAGQIAEKVKTLLGRTIPADAVPYAGQLGELIGGAIGAGVTDKLKTVLGKGIPGAVAEAVASQAKALMSDKNRSDEAKAGKMGKLGQGEFTRQGEGGFGTAADAALTQAPEMAGGQGEFTALAFTEKYQETMLRLQPETEANLIQWFADVRANAVRPALLGFAQQAYLGGQTAMDSLGDGMYTGLGYIEDTVSAVNGALASIPRDITVNIHANVDPVLERHSPSLLEQTLMSIHALAGSVPVVDLRTMGGGGRVSPPASPTQIMRQASINSTTNSFAWSGNMILPPGTPQSHGDALIDYLQSRGS